MDISGVAAYVLIPTLCEILFQIFHPEFLQALPLTSNLRLKQNVGLCLNRRGANPNNANTIIANPAEVISCEWIYYAEGDYEEAYVQPETKSCFIRSDLFVCSGDQRMGPG